MIAETPAHVQYLLINLETRRATAMTETETPAEEPEDTDETPAEDEEAPLVTTDAPPPEDKPVELKVEDDEEQP